MIYHMQQHLHHGHPDEFQQLLRSRSIRAFGWSLAFLFIPIYLMNLYGGLKPALLAITLFLSVMCFGRMLLMPIVAHLITKFGAKHVIASSYLIGGVALVAVGLIQPNLWSVMFAAILVVINESLFFVALHYDLSKTLNDDPAEKKKIGLAEITRKVTMALGPLFGGMIATRLGETELFVLAGVIASCSVVALYLKNEKVHDYDPKSHYLDMKLTRDHLGELLAGFAMGANNHAAHVLWPLLIFLVLGTYEAVGLILAASLVLSLLIIAFIRKRDTFSDDKNQILVGSIGTSVIHGARPFADSFASASGINFFNDISYSVLFTPYIDRYYKNIGSFKNSLSYIVTMETFIMAGCLFPWLVFVLSFVFLGQTPAFIISFISSAIAVLMMNFMSHK